MRLGSFLPVVDCKDQDGQVVNLGELASLPCLFVFFFPKANTPGCVHQACSLRDANEDLVERGLTVVGVSRDSPEVLRKYKADKALPYDLFSDEDKSLSVLFGVPSIFGIVKRQAFLFEYGVATWIDRSASTRKQASDLLAQIK